MEDFVAACQFSTRVIVKNIKNSINLCLTRIMPHHIFMQLSSCMYCVYDVTICENFTFLSMITKYFNVSAQVIKWLE